MWPFKRKKPVNDTWWLGGILLAALALRLINISAQPYWGDEVLSLDIVRHFARVGDMLRYLSQVEFHPPLYYLMLRPWVAAFGGSTGATRALSLVFSLGNVVMAYLLGKHVLASRTAGLYAAGIMAVLPMQIQYAQEARPYAIFCFVAALSALALWEHLRTRDMRWFAAYCLASILGLWLHYSYFFVLGATSSWWFIVMLRREPKLRWTEFKYWLAAHAVVFLGFYPWLVFMLYKISLGKFDFLGAARMAAPYRTPGLFGLLVDQLLWMARAKYLYVAVIIGTLVFKVVFVWFAIAVIARRAHSGGDDGAGLGACWFLGWLFVVPLALFVASPQSLPYSTVYMRHVIFATVPLALAIGLVASALPKKRAAVLLALFIVSQIPFVAGAVGNDYEWDQDYRLQDAGEYISRNYRPGDLVIVSVSIVRADLAHYLRPDIPMTELLPIPYYDGGDIWASSQTLGLVENESQVRIARPSEAEIKEKLDRLYKIHHPKRVWLYAFAQTDFAVHHWFTDKHWRHAFSAIGDVFRVDLYSEK